MICCLTFRFTDNCDLHLKVAPGGLSGKPLADEGFSYLLAGARATWGTAKGKVCFECKVAMQSLCIIIPLLWHFTLFGQENAQNMRRQYTVMSQFRTEQIRTERQLLNERNCFQSDTKPENLACHRWSLVISFIQSNKVQ